MMSTNRLFKESNDSKNDIDACIDHVLKDYNRLNKMLTKLYRAPEEEIWALCLRAPGRESLGDTDCTSLSLCFLHQALDSLDHQPDLAIVVVSVANGACSHRGGI